MEDFLFTFTKQESIYCVYLPTVLSILDMLNINTEIKEHSQSNSIQDSLLKYWYWWEHTISLQAENTYRNNSMDSLPHANHLVCFCSVYLSCSKTFWKPSKHRLLETCFSAMASTANQETRKEKLNLKIKYFWT